MRGADPNMGDVTPLNNPVIPSFLINYENTVNAEMSL